MRTIYTYMAEQLITTQTWYDIHVIYTVHTVYNKVIKYANSNKKYLIIKTIHESKLVYLSLFIIKLINANNLIIICHIILIQKLETIPCWTALSAYIRLCLNSIILYIYKYFVAYNKWLMNNYKGICFPSTFETKVQDNHMENKCHVPCR